MTEDQVTDQTDESTEEPAAEPDTSIGTAQVKKTPIKKLSMAQRVDRLEDLLIKGGVVDAGSLGW